MPITTTDDPTKVTAQAGHRTRTTRLFYTSLRDHYAEAMEARALAGNANKPCAVCAWLKDHLDDDVIEGEAHLFSDPEIGPEYLCNAIAVQPYFHNRNTLHGEAIAATTQHDLALALVSYHPWERARPHLETLFRTKRTTISPKALFVLLAHLNANHPNPRRFLEQAAVASKLPSDLELHRFAAPDFDAPA